MHLKPLLLGALVVLLITELTSALSGSWVWRTEELLYPAFWYPDDELPIFVTQTIQLTCYLFGTMGSLIHLA